MRLSDRDHLIIVCFLVHNLPTAYSLTQRRFKVKLQLNLLTLFNVTVRLLRIRSVLYFV
jgi:hypothetical protein